MSDLSRIPDDLVPLSQVAQKLRVDSRTLVEASAIGDFPTIYRVSRRAWRVSESSVASWLESRDAASELRRDEDHRRRLSAVIRSEAVWCP